MKLSVFIVNNIEPILQAWEDYAKTIFPEGLKVNIKELRDHAKKMLMTIVSDMDSPQSKLEQNTKSKGLALRTDKNLTPAEKHGDERQAGGFTINELVAEFRALRASVIQLSNESGRKISFSDPYDMVRFNESIDQAIAESIAEYTRIQEKQIRHFNELISGSPDLYYTLDLEGNITYMNAAMSALYTQPSFELLYKAIYNYAMPKAADILENIQYIIKTGKNCEGEVFYKDEQGNERTFKYKVAPIFDENGTIEAIAGASREITEQKQSEKQIWQNANYDLLTGLTNRLMFNNKLEEAIKNSKRSDESLAILFIDLDKFKEANDTLGHAEGDCLLKQVAERINNSIRETDIASRIGGDEFVVILNNIQNAEEAKSVAEKILSQLRKPFKLMNKIAQISASIGMTLSPQDGLIPDVLLNNADQAMYTSKKSGHDCSTFWSLKS